MKSLTSCQVNRMVVRRNPARPGMKSHTGCQANRTRTGMRTVRGHPIGPGIKSLTNCQANRTRVEVRTVGRGTSNHLLTIKPLNRTRVGVRAIRWHPTGPGIKSLTDCYANRTRVPVPGVRTIRRHPVGPGIKSLTCCQVNRTRVGVRIVRRHSAVDLGWHKVAHLLLSQ